MKFFATIAQAFIESRQRQAERVIRDHLFFRRYDVRMAVENMHMVERPKPDAAGSTSVTELKLAA